VQLIIDLSWIEKDILRRIILLKISRHFWFNIGIIIMKKIVTILLLSMAICSMATAEDDYAIPVKQGDTSTSIVESYLTGSSAWEQVKDYNQLLKPGNMVKVPSHLVNLKGKAIITLAYGEVKVKLVGEERWVDAIPGLIIQEGDHLETGLDSGVEITMEEGDRAILREDTSIVFNPPDNTTPSMTTLLNVIRGKAMILNRSSSPLPLLNSSNPWIGKLFWSR